VQRAQLYNVIHEHLIIVFFLSGAAVNEWERHLAGTSDAHLPDANLVVGVSSKQGLTISRPGQGGHLWRLSAGRAGDLGSQILDEVLALEIPDLDAWSRGCTEPVPVGGEGQAVDGVTAIKSVQVFAIVEVPQHCLGVLAATGTEGTIRRQSDGVEISSVTDVVGLQLAVGQVPDLDVLVPAAGDDDGVLGVGREPDAADPVAVTLVLDGVLALGQGVPQLDGLVPAGGHDLPVVSGEGHRQHVLGVVLEPAGGLAGAQIPQT